MKLLKFPHKRLRAEIIYDYVLFSQYRGVVLLSCGNAIKWMRWVVQKKQKGKSKFACKVEVAEMTTTKWLTNEQIGNMAPTHFEATSGHLPLWLMVRIAKKFRNYFNSHGGLPLKKYYVPTGSGETILCLKLAYPKKEFVAVYNVSRGSKYEKKAPLNDAVTALFETHGIR